MKNLFNILLMLLCSIGCISALTAESTEAFVNTRGIRVNEEINDSNSLLTKGASITTGLEK